MAIYTSLTGLSGAQTELSAISNNIANVGSTGFKKSRAEFGDIIGSSGLSDPGKLIGLGSALKGIRQQFTQGSVQATGNTLDLALTGSGFFMLRSDRGEVTFTRNGAFKLDDQRYAVDDSGTRVQVFPVNADGVVTAAGLDSTVPLRLPITSGLPQATSAIDVEINLPSTAAVPGLPFNPATPASYNATTSTTVFDSNGNPLTATIYYRRTAGAPDNTWDAYVQVGNDVLTHGGGTQAIPLDFDAFGALTATSVTLDAYTPPSGGTPLSIAFGHTDGTTQTADPLNVLSLTQNGYAAGRLDSVTIDSEGLVRAGFTNGQTQAVGKLAIADFANPSGLKQLGNARYSATGSSGALLVGEAGSQGLGTVISGSLERSNVDLTEELVNLIVAQRNFQANAKAVETDTAMTQSILNIRS